jgi:tetratricopeptide (TPR) repeat protein
MNKVDMLKAVVQQATSLRAEGKIREALDCLSNAIVTLPVSHIGMSKSLFDELRYPIATLRAARAYCNVKLGFFADAQVDSAAALSLVPEDVSFELLAAHVHYVSGDFKLAAKFASEVVADCGGDDGDEDTDDLIKRASTLLKRCAIDRSFDATSPNISLTENDSYDSDVEFERTLKGLGSHWRASAIRVESQWRVSTASSLLQTHLQVQ